LVFIFLERHTGTNGFPAAREPSEGYIKAGTLADFARFIWHFLVMGSLKMDQRDQELLDKQLRRLNPSPRNDGVIVLAILAVFFAGITLGGFLSAYKSEPMQIASNDATPAISIPNVPPPITRH
jgi:hypothetical protein